MLRLAALLASTALAITPAFAGGHSGPGSRALGGHTALHYPTTVRCPKAAAGYHDGCMSGTAPAGIPSNAYANGPGLIQFPNFFTCTAAVHCGPASGQSYINRPPFDVAGVDYPVGSWTSVAAMCDPSAQSGACTLPAGCTYAAQNNTTTPVTPASVYCTKPTSGNVNMALHGWNFDVTSNHGAVKVTFDKSLTGNVSVYNNNFGADSVQFVYDAFHGGFGLLDFSIGYGSYYVYNNNFYGRSQTLNYTGAKNNGDAAVNFSSNSHPAVFAFAYNATFNTTRHQISITTGSLTASQIFIGYNYGEGWDDLIGFGHGEIFGFEGVAAWLDFEFNSFVASQDMCNCGTTVIYPSAVNGTAIGWLQINGNTIIAGNHVGGAALSHGYAYTATIDNGAGTGVTPGGILTVKSQTGGTDGPTFGMNSAYTINGTTYSVEIAGHVPGSPASGVGSQWYISTSQGAVYTLPPQVSLASGGALAWNPGAFISYPQGMTFNWGQITGANPTSGKSITITNNFVDWTKEVAGTNLWQINGAGVSGSYACASGSIVTGNQDLTTHSPLAAVNTLQVSKYATGSTGGC